MRVWRAGVQVWDKFEEIDTSDDGRLDIDEFKHGCEVLGERMTEDEARFLLHPSTPTLLCHRRRCTAGTCDRPKGRGLHSTIKQTFQKK